MKIFIFSILFLLSGCASKDIIKKPFGFKTQWQEGSPNTKLLDDGSIQIDFLKDNIGPRYSGFNWSADLEPKDEYTISYEVKFAEDFDFVKGGKLPGFCGGKFEPGKIPNGEDAFSSRIMWRQNGRIVSYVYHMNQKSIYGDDLEWREASGKNLLLVPGKWHKIQFTLKLNDALNANGMISASFDEKEALVRTDLKFRTTEKLKIDKLCFNTFFGGNDQSWAPNKEQTLWIRNLVVR